MSTSNDSEFKGPLGVLKFIGIGFLMIIGGIFEFLFDLLGFYFLVGLNFAVVIGAYLVNPTLGQVVLYLVVGGWILYGVLNVAALFGGDKLLDRAMGKKQPE